MTQLSRSGATDWVMMAIGANPPRVTCYISLQLDTKANTMFTRAVTRRQRLKATAIDSFVALSAFAVFLAPGRGDMGLLAGLLLAVSASVLVYLVLQAGLLLTRGSTLGMGYLQLQLTPHRPWRFMLANCLVVLAPFTLLLDNELQARIRQQFDVLHTIIQETIPWQEAVVCTAAALAPNLLCLLLPDARTLADRLSGTRLVPAARAGVDFPKSRLPAYALNIALLSLPIFPALVLATLAGSSAEGHPFLPGVASLSVLLALQIWALHSTGETIGVRVLRGRRER